jgi:very-short-patch-repair endonuclease
MVKCEKCGLEYTKKGIRQHLKEHDNGLKLDYNIVEMIINDYIGNMLSLRKLYEKYNVSANYIRKILKGKTRSLSQSSIVAHKKYPDAFKMSNEARDKIRKARVKYLKNKNNREKTAWWNKATGTLSYGEQYIHDIFVKNYIYNKFDVVNEYCEYPYFIDFAFVNEKVAVEFDGKCHFSNGKERIEHDINRDKILLDKGWRMYRIAYYELEVFDINDLLRFIGNPETKQLKSQLEKYNNVKERVNKQKIKVNKRKLNENRYEKEQIAKIDLMMKSDIDFSKFGWVNSAATLLNIKPQKVNIWMKRFMLDFYNEHCFKRM